MAHPRSGRPVRELFMERTNAVGACLEWTGPTDRDGYGEWQYAKIRTRAHRWAYRLFVGKFPATAIVCHTCDNPKCCRPNHLFIGTQQDNMQDMVQKGRKAPKYGEHHHLRKLDDATVLAMRARYDGRRGTTTAIAREFNLPYHTVRDAITGRRWKHLP